MKVEELPAVVIKRAGADFSVYILIIILTKRQKNAREVYCYDIGMTIRI
jgi:hypothetical protein